MKEINQDIKVAVDAVIFQVQDGVLHVLAIQMKKKPFTGMWAVPGGLVKNNETSEQAALRILKEQTGVSGVHLEQVQAFDDVKRDPLRRVISVGHFALVPKGEEKLKTTEKYMDVRWMPVKKLPKLAYDHNVVVKASLTKLQRRLAFTNVVWSLLPKEFTLTDLQGVYESILGTKLDKRNFRRKMLSLGIVSPTGKKQVGEAFRPAELYRFRKRKLEFIDV